MYIQYPLFIQYFSKKTDGLKILGSYPGLGSRSRSEPGVFGSLEPEPEQLEKKTRSRSRLEKKSGAGAGKN